MAAELGLDLKEIRGSGPEGRIVKRDVEEASRRGGTRPAGEATSRPAGAPKTGPLLKDFTPLAIAELPADDHEDVPVSSMRKVIASRLAESKFTAPHYYVTVEVDMRAADRAREELNQLAGLEVTYNDLVVKAAATALTRHPGVNASWQDEHIRRYSSVDIGIAVALPDGLITPVVRGCHLKTLGRISVEIKDLAERARTKKLAPEEFQGGTFTVSNMGMFGVKQFTAIINPPEAAILAVGAALDVPVVENGTIVPGRRMCLTLSADHRAVDGAQAALFLREVKLLLERPMALAL
jgi:pyruvate dehydrogenase E2 component (dihydrolipoamide acetyltransferase)